MKNPVTSDWMKWRYSTHLFSSLGELWLARGDPAKAREFAEQCLELATRTDSRKYLVKGYRLKGEIALIQHKWEDAESMLRQSLSIAEAIGDPTQLWKTHFALGQLRAETRKAGAARGAYRAARDVLDRMKANVQDPRLHASLESSPLIRHIYEL